MKTAHNPILKGFYPDPSICRVGGDYYLVNSTFSYVPGVPVFHSTNLADWEQIGNVLTRKSQLVLDGAAMSRGIFAPTIRYHKGFFYMITTNVSYGGNFYVTASDPAGEWSDPVYLKVPEGVDAGIDPSLYFEGDKCYYVGQRQKADARFYGDCEVWLQELDLDKGELTGKNYSLYAGAMKEACWVEGPHLYKIGDYYYITCAEMGTSFEHSICVARSKNLTGPYENYKCNPLLTHRHLGRNYPIQNIGHGDLVDTPEGEWYLVMLGTRPLRGAAQLGRETFLAKVEWEEGWPVVNPGEGRVLWEQTVQETVEEPGKELAAEESVEEQAEESVKQAESAEPARVPAFAPQVEMKFTTPRDIRFLTFRHPADDMIRIISEKECELKCADAAPEDTKGMISYLGIRQQDRCFSIKVQVGTKLPKGAGAGLLYLYNDDNYICLLFRQQEEKSQVSIEKREQGAMQSLGNIPAEKETQYLETDWLDMEIRGKDQRAEFFVQGQKIGETAVDFMCAERAGGFVGCTYGIYALGREEGYARFRNLQVEYHAEEAEARSMMSAKEC